MKNCFAVKNTKKQLTYLCSPLSSKYNKQQGCQVACSCLKHGWNF